MITLDANGLVAVIGATVAGVVSMGTFAMQVVSYVDQRNLKKAQDELKLMSSARDIQIGQVKELVNGKSEQLQALVAKDAYEQGRMHERIAPGTPSPVLAVVPVPSVATAVVQAPGDPANG